MGAGRSGPGAGWAGTIAQTGWLPGGVFVGNRIRGVARFAALDAACRQRHVHHRPRLERRHQAALGRPDLPHPRPAEPHRYDVDPRRRVPQRHRPQRPPPRRPHRPHRQRPNPDRPLSPDLPRLGCRHAACSRLTHTRRRPEPPARASPRSPGAAFRPSRRSTPSSPAGRSALRPPDGRSVLRSGERRLGLRGGPCGRLGIRRRPRSRRQILRPAPSPRPARDSGPSRTR